LADPLVLVPDARFGGGGQAMIDAFIYEMQMLGKSAATLSTGYVPGVDSINQVLQGFRYVARARRADSLWVVAAAAPYGFAAPRSGRPYACWIATSLEEEWRSRIPGLSRSRRYAYSANASLLRRLERRVLAEASLVFGISPASRDALRQAGRRDDVEILPIPIALDRFTPEPDEAWTARLAQPTVVFVGRGDDPRKNVDLLLEAWPAIRSAVPQARLVLVGRAPARAVPTGVEVRGEVADVAVELRRGTLFVLPSLQEGFGIVAAEALACGVPVVSTPSGGPHELIRESGGGDLLGTFTADELAESVVGLLRDSQALLRMRRAGRAYVAEHHSPAAFRTALEKSGALDFR
jgi:glycosyltransferase involved in cell wall biosynthesis